MSPWIARYEEGYETSSGETVTLTDQLHEAHQWRDPEHARRHWAMRPDLEGDSVVRDGNGICQRVRVDGRPEFAHLNVVAIWRRVTFRYRD